MNSDPSPTSATIDPAATGPAGGDADLVCIRCGYSLTSLDPRRPCPECGLLVGFSLLDGSELRHNRPRWLTLLAIGAGILALATLFFPGVGIAAAMFQASRFAGTTDWTLWGIAAAMSAVPSVGLIVGTWLITVAAGPQRSDHTPRYTRISLRMLSLTPLLVMSVTAAASAGGLSYEWMDLIEGPAPWIGMFLCLAVYYAWLFWHLKSLAARAPAPMLAADSPIVGSVLGASIVVVILCGMVIARSPYGYGDLVDALHIVMGVTAAVGLTAGIWSVYLLARYAFAFGSTAAQARQLMRYFDASRNPGAVGYHPAP